MTIKDKQFADVLLEAIDEAFSTLGETSKSAIFMYLENKFALPKQEIPCRVADFSNALEEIFGLAAKQLQILIMKCLNKRVNGSYKWSGPHWLVPDLTFEKYLVLMQIAYEDNRKTGNVEVVLDDGEKNREV